MTTISLGSAPRIRAVASAQPSPVTQLRLTARGRRVLAAVVVASVAVVLIVFSFIFAGQAEASQQGGVVDFQYVTVGHGDTLWSLAVEVAPQEDPREVIADFKRLNALSSSSVIPGQHLAIPPAYATER